MDDCNALAQLMISRESPVARQLRTVLGINRANKIHETENLGLEDIKIRAGGRHDNDKADFRSIRVMPTIQEISSEDVAYLPQNIVTDEAGALERQFRLLREDMVGPARRELRLLRNGEGNLRNLFNGVSIERVNIPDGKTSIPPHVLVSFDLHPEHKTMKYKKRKNRKDYWETFSKGIISNYTKHASNIRPSNYIIMVKTNFITYSRNASKRFFGLLSFERRNHEFCFRSVS